MLHTELLHVVRQHNPLVHNITNIVVANYVANGLLALGASPIMSSALEEMDDLTKICSAVAINIGTLTHNQVSAMLIAGKAANAHETPVLLDPVGVGATAFRRDTINELLDQIHCTAVRGNAGEMAMLAGVSWQTQGVDAGSGDGDLYAIAQTVAQHYNTIAIISGEVDVISDGVSVYEVANGTPLFPYVTGSGCLHGAVCAAFIACASTQPLQAAVTACAVYAVAGELAAQADMKSGTFATAFIDGLNSITPEHVAQRANVREITL